MKSASILKRIPLSNNLRKEAAQDAEESLVSCDRPRRGRPNATSPSGGSTRFPSEATVPKPPSSAPRPGPPPASRHFRLPAPSHELVFVGPPLPAADWVAPQPRLPSDWL